MTLRDLLERRAEGAGASAAIRAPGRRPLTSAGLVDHIDATAAHLAELGVGSGDRVAIVLPNGPEMATAFLAAAACATSAPLNPGYRAEEYEFFLNDLEAKVLVTGADSDSPAVDVAHRLGVPVLRVHVDPDASAGTFALVGEQPREPVTRTEPGPSDVALVLHTSGTTSRPKLVPLTHANLCASAANIAAALALTADDVCLNVMPLFHIHGLMGATLSSLCAGGSVVCTPGFDQQRFFDWIEECAPTWYTAVPTMHQAVLAAAADRGAAASAARLRLIRSSSSPLPPQVMADLEELFGAPVIESYGMTEAAHQMTSNPLPPGRRVPGSVGLAAGPDVAIMDAAGRLLDAGETGEIVIRGPNVTTGYDKNPEATTAAFTDGWFRTGDEGHLDADGYLFISGRIKEIINRGGEKISPREIDEALLDHPDIAQATTFAVPHPTLGEDVATAVVVTDADEPPSSKELRDFAFARLADFKVPSQVIVVDQIPKGPTGKLQRIGLADKLEAQLRVDHVPPRSTLETVLAAVWSSVLGIDEVGVHDNFFALGGDSLLAAQCFVGIERELGLRLPLAALFQAPTIEQLAELIDAGSWEKAWSPVVPIQAGGTKPPLYFVHAHGGNVVGYIELAMRLGTDQPFFGLQARGLDGSPVEATSIEEIARDYVAAVRRHQPRGPYHLGGWCLGGVIAYEMARQFAADGDEVPVTVMVQATLPDYPRPKPALRWTRPLLRTIDRLDQEWSALRESASPRRRDHIRSRARRALDLMQYRARSVAERVHPLGPDGRPTQVHQPALETAHTEAFENYRPRPFGGTVAIIRAAKQPRAIERDPTLGWGPALDGPVILREIPGHQLQMLDEPRVAIVAETIADVLAQAHRS